MNYREFIEAQKSIPQKGKLEAHHIKSQKNFPELAYTETNVILLSVDNHDYATLLQCEEENFPLLCPWQAARLHVTHPELGEKIDYWMSERGKKSAEYTSTEACSKGGNVTAERRKERGELSEWAEYMQSHRGEYPPAAWYWRVNPETGKPESKLWVVPEGEGWQPGRGESVNMKGVKSYERRRVRCTITGHEGTQQSLARWQKNRGIDPSNREFIG